MLKIVKIIILCIIDLTINLPYKEKVTEKIFEKDFKKAEICDIILEYENFNNEESI